MHGLQPQPLLFPQPPAFTHLHEKPVPPSAKRAGIPESIEQVVLACLAKKPDDRPKDATTLAALIRACALGDWALEEAHAWWVARNAKSTSRAGKQGAKETEVSALGKTIAVALDGRELS